MVNILFKTGRFNLSKIGPDFINDCCFGEDFLAWLHDKLALAGYVVDEPFQEDWGWALMPRRSADNYFVGSSGVSDGDPKRPDYGEWRIFIEQRPSLKDRLLKRTSENTLAIEVEKLLAGEADFEEVHLDAE